MHKFTAYIRPEDYGRVASSDIMEFKPVDMNYAFVPLNKDEAGNMDKTSECNLKRFNLEPKDKPSEY